MPLHHQLENLTPEENRWSRIDPLSVGMVASSKLRKLVFFMNHRALVSTAKTTQVWVSLTTTSLRLPLAIKTIESILSQSFAPNRFVLNLSEEPYLLDSGIQTSDPRLGDIPIEIQFTKNTGPYRKLLPLIFEAPDDVIVVTIDDDVLFHPTWLESLTNLARVHADKVVCTRARQVARNLFGSCRSYLRWNPIGEFKAGIDLLPIGYGGIAYRKPLLNLDWLADEEFMTIAPTTDDFWFRAASLLSGANVVVAPQLGSMIDEQQETESLSDSNLTRGATSSLEWTRNLARNLTLGEMGATLTKNDEARKRIRTYAQRTYRTRVF